MCNYVRSGGFDSRKITAGMTLRLKLNDTRRTHVVTLFNPMIVLYTSREILYPQKEVVIYTIHMNNHIKLQFKQPRLVACSADAPSTDES